MNARNNGTSLPLVSKDPQKAFRSELYFLQQMTIRNTEIARKIASGEGRICVMDRSAISVLVYSAALSIHPNDFQQLAGQCMTL